MIEPAAAREVVEQLGRVEVRLGRLLTSGWRQASAEAAELRQAADDLAATGLTEVAARVTAVAEAVSAGEALAAIALASSACRLLRSRLLTDPVPDGWEMHTPRKTRARTGTDTLLPIARLQLDGREVWACFRQLRGRLLLIEPPFVSEVPSSEPSTPRAPQGVFGRIRQQIGQALGGATASPGQWLDRRLRGSLVWRAAYPLGAEGQVTLCALQDALWVAEPAECDDLQALHQMLKSGRLVEGGYLFGFGSGFRLMELRRDDAAAYVWLDPSSVEAFGYAPTAHTWAIVWLDGAAVLPVALVSLDRSGGSPRIVHLVPGLPSDALAV